MRFYFVGLLVLCSFFSCGHSNHPSVDVTNIEVDFNVKRFEQDFYQASEQTLPQVKAEYPYFFPENVTDSIAISKIRSQEEQELFLETQKVFEDFSTTHKELEKLFKHVKYYNPKFSSPDVVTMITNIDYESRVIYADSLLLLSLDAYLGKDHPFYVDFPEYIRQNNQKNHLIVDVAKIFVDIKMPPKSHRRFVDKIIAEGKKMYLLDAYLPEVSNLEKIGYSAEKMEWAMANEEQVWVYFIENKLLYSTDTQLSYRFIKDAPFSKFYTAQDNLSPGRIGVWIGWQIVRSFMEKNDVSLQELLKMNEEELFRKSKYKPRN